MALPTLRSTPAGEPAPPDPLPTELGSVLLSMATAAVPISLVSGLAEHLSRALAGRRLSDADVVALAAVLSRAAGPWLPTRQRFERLVQQLDVLLSRAGCDCGDVQAIVSDLERTYRLRVAPPH